MLDQVVFVLVLLASVGSALIAGSFFAFSTFVMKALSRLPAAQGIAAMQHINVVVLNRAFLSVFLGSTLACAIVVACAVFRLHEAAACLQVAGGSLYFFGTFVITMVCNVPRNNGLAAINPESVESEHIWRRYVSEWTFWNHVRTAAALLAAVLLILGLQR